MSSERGKSVLVRTWCAPQCSSAVRNGVVLRPPRGGGALAQCARHSPRTPLPRQVCAPSALPHVLCVRPCSRVVVLCCPLFPSSLAPRAVTPRFAFWSCHADVEASFSLSLHSLLSHVLSVVPFSFSFYFFFKSFPISLFLHGAPILRSLSSFFLSSDSAITSQLICCVEQGGWRRHPW